MIEGVLRHCTDASIDRQYTDTHGQSVVGFAFAHLLGFRLLPRMKNVAHQKLVKVEASDPVPANLVAMVADKPITGERHLFRACCIPERLPVLRSLGRPGSAGGVRHETSASGLRVIVGRSCR